MFLYTHLTLESTLNVKFHQVAFSFSCFFARFFLLLFILVIFVIVILHIVRISWVERINPLRYQLLVTQHLKSCHSKRKIVLYLILSSNYHFSEPILVSMGAIINNTRDRERTFATRGHEGSISSSPSSFLSSWLCIADSFNLSSSPRRCFLQNTYVRRNFH